MCCLQQNTVNDVLRLKTPKRIANASGDGALEGHRFHCVEANIAMKLRHWGQRFKVSVFETVSRRLKTLQQNVNALETHSFRCAFSYIRDAVMDKMILSTSKVVLPISQ